MRIRKSTLFSLLFFLFTTISCELFYGPKINKVLDIEHISSNLINNLGIGDDWSVPQYSINESVIDISVTNVIQLSTWDNLISCGYTEFDDTYPDNGNGILDLPLYQMIKKYGNNFDLNIQTIIYEQRSNTYSTNGDHATWQDTFHINISDL